MAPIEPERRSQMKPSKRIVHLAGLVLLATFGACAPAMRTTTPTSEGGNRLPPVPAVRGALDIEVVYPGEGARIATRDSTFVFGNIGNGDATLTVNGAPVEVANNGAWLAFLPVPADGIYRLVATTSDGRSAELTRTVQVPAAGSATTSSALRIVPGSISPTGSLSGYRGESFEVSFRGTPGAVARLRLPDGRVIPMVEQRAVDRRSGFMLQQSTSSNTVAEYVGSFDLDRFIAGDADTDMPKLAASGLAAADTARAVVELVRGTEIVTAPIPAAIAVVEPTRPRVAVAATSRPDSTVIGRRHPGSDQSWDFFWPNGTLFTVDGEVPGYYRVRLTPELTAWISADDAELLDAATPAPRGYVGPSIELTPMDDRVEVRFSMSDRLPFRVDPGEFGLSVEFYGAYGRAAYLGYGRTDEFVERFDWEQQTDDLFEFRLHLNRALWGYQYRWEGTTLVLDVRRPPAVDPAAPLRGLTVAVDAGHMGYDGDSGAVGPTGLTEVESTLKVTRALSALLRAEGANVIEIRPDEAVVPLIDRPITAAERDADLFLSVHFNAFPDGVNPFENHGTTVFYFWPQALDFARHMQSQLVGEFGLPDRGVRYQNLAISRTQWMPSILTETLFLMFPQQEAALKDPAFVQRIADAHFRAIRDFTAERVQARPSPSDIP